MCAFYDVIGVRWVIFDGGGLPVFLKMSADQKIYFVQQWRKNFFLGIGGGAIG